MITHYLLVYWRRMKKNPVANFLLLLVLSICLSAAYLTFSLARYELSFEDYNPKADQTFRISRKVFRDGEQVIHSAQVFSALKNDLQANFPDVQNAARLIPRDGVILYGDKKFNEHNVYNADNEIIDLLSLNIISGNQSTPLVSPRSAIISKRYSGKYFGDESPLNRVIRLNDEFYTIVSVFDDMPANSHLSMDIVLSYSTFSHLSRFEESKTWNHFYTYVQLHPGVDVSSVKSKITAYYKSTFVNDNVEVKFELTPVSSINLSAILSDDIIKHSEGEQRVRLLFAASFVLFFIALLNYGNITASNLMDKMQEINIRKVLGATRASVFRQIVIENLFVGTLAVVLAVVLLSLAVPYLRQSAVISPTHIFSWSNLIPFFTLFIACFIIICSFGVLSARFLSGGYLRNLSNSGVSLKIRQVFFGLQLVIMLVICHFSFSLVSQYTHLRNGNTGFNPDDLLVVEWPGIMDSVYSRKLKSFTHTTQANSKVSAFTISTSVPGEPIIDYHENAVRSKLSKGLIKEKIYFIYTDKKYFEVFDVELLAGRLLSDDANDEFNVVLSSKTTSLLGFSDPDDAIGEYVTVSGEDYEIIGVVEDYHHESFKSTVEPIIFYQDFDKWGYFSFRGNFQSPGVFEDIRKQWELLVPDSPFDFIYMKDRYAKNYEREARLGKIFAGFAIVSVAMIITGLFGIVSLTLQRKLKSFAIRKIFGASLQRLSVSLSKEFMVIVLLATAVAIPVSYQLITFWLKDYASRIDMSAMLFLSPVMVVLFIALLLVLVMLYKRMQSVLLVIRGE